MTQEHPITPPPELVKQWATANGTVYKDLSVFCQNIATQAARWGADQELEACCVWLHWQNLATHPDLIPSLRAARRPKPPSLKEQALSALYAITSGADDTREFYQDIETVKKALKSLPE